MAAIRLLLWAVFIAIEKLASAPAINNGTSAGSHATLPCIQPQGSVRATTTPISAVLLSNHFRSTYPMSAAVSMVAKSEKARSAYSDAPNIATQAAKGYR